MAIVKKVNMNEWAVKVLRELADDIESGIARVESQQLENAMVAFVQDGVVVHALNGERRMNMSWFDPRFDNRDKVVGDVLADGFLDEPKHMALAGEGMAIIDDPN